MLFPSASSPSSAVRFPDPPMSVQPSRIAVPELMAPAGAWDCAGAAVENGADAVYFGLQGGLNARARAANFREAELPELMTFLRTRGVKGYLTLNTLVFGDELKEAERIARVAAEAGIDAVLVQDLGLLRLLHCLCPELPLHASTQMTHKQRRVHPRGRVARRAEGRAAARALDRPDRRHPSANCCRTRSVCTRGTVHQLFGPMPGQLVAGRAKRQSRPMCPALPAALRGDLRRPAARCRRQALSA